MTQPDGDQRTRLREDYENDAPALIAVTAVVPTQFQTIARAKNYWNSK